MVNPSEEFLRRMREMLGADYPAYEAALSSKRTRGLRVNRGKTDAESLEKALKIGGRVPFFENGFFLKDQKFGTHPYHHAGLFYLQEPSAMLPVAAIRPYLHGMILDLCAAPGGKSTQILDCMEEGSFLFCNEIVSARASVLCGNLERWGAENYAVLNMNPKDMEQPFSEVFDAIVVDAPCSGEGMFRKEEAALLSWSEENVRSCAMRQTEILRSAAKMLRPGGVMVYSTCTLNREENEGVILRFLEEEPTFSTLEPEPEVRSAVDRGFGLSEAMRLFPHKFPGEGHFACLLKKNGEGETARKSAKNSPLSPLFKEKREAEDLLSSLGVQFFSERLLRFRDTVYLTGEGFFTPDKIHLYRAGTPVLTDKNGRLEPCHGAAMLLKKGQAKKQADFPAESAEIAAYLAGEQIAADIPFTGFGVIAADGYPLGLVKASGGALKNHYPKGLRQSP